MRLVYLYMNRTVAVQNAFYIAELFFFHSDTAVDAAINHISPICRTDRIWKTVVTVAAYHVIEHALRDGADHRPAHARGRVILSLSSYVTEPNYETSAASDDIAIDIVFGGIVGGEVIVGIKRDISAVELL